MEPLYLIGPYGALKVLHMPTLSPSFPQRLPKWKAYQKNVQEGIGRHSRVGWPCKSLKQHQKRLQFRPNSTQFQPHTVLTSILGPNLKASDFLMTKPHQSLTSIPPSPPEPDDASPGTNFNTSDFPMIASTCQVASMPSPYSRPPLALSLCEVPLAIFNKTIERGCYWD